jgi:hypothetical protein
VPAFFSRGHHEVPIEMGSERAWTGEHRSRDLKGDATSVAVDSSSLQFRTEMYNALNHPQFADPDNDFASPAFGIIGGTRVNPCVVQFALKLAF